MVSDSQRKAEANYRKKLYSLVVRFYLTDEDQRLMEHVQAQPNKQAYIKSLIENDMCQNVPKCANGTERNGTSVNENTR